jgi:hypothetical protein
LWIEKKSESCLFSLATVLVTIFHMFCVPVFALDGYYSIKSLVRHGNGFETNGLGSEEANWFPYHNNAAKHVPHLRLQAMVIPLLRSWASNCS